MSREGGIYLSAKVHGNKYIKCSEREIFDIEKWINNALQQILADNEFVGMFNTKKNKQNNEQWKSFLDDLVYKKFYNLSTTTPNH